MIIFIDQDNVLNKFIDQVVHYVEKLYNLKMNFSSADCKQWGIVEEIFPHMSKESVDKMTETIFRADRFWAEMEVQPKAPQIVKKLIEKGHEVYIVTAPWTTALNCKSEKEEWIKRVYLFLTYEMSFFVTIKNF